MASKFGGQQASKNQWVMQQNMARHKSILSFVHKPQPPKPKAAPAKPAPAPTLEPDAGVDVAVETPKSSAP